MKVEIIDTIRFREKYPNYRGIVLEVRRAGRQIRFYEVGEREFCLSRDMIKWLLDNHRVENSYKLKKYLRRWKKEDTQRGR